PPPVSTLFPYTTLFRSYLGPHRSRNCGVAHRNFAPCPRRRRLTARERHVDQRAPSRIGAGFIAGARGRRSKRKKRYSARDAVARDRKSTRLNSSHLVIS